MAIDDNFSSFDDSAADASLAISPAFDLPLIEDLSDPFPLEKLETGEFFVIVKRLVSETIRCDQVPDALELIVRLRLLKESKQQYPDLLAKYQPLINLLKFVSLAARKDSEIIRLFEQGLLAALRARIDVKDKIQSRLILYGYFEPDDVQFVRNLIYALEHNEEVLGSQPLQIIEENRKLVPNSGNWLKDYNAKSRGRSGSVGRAAYMSQSANVRRLMAQEQKVLLNILELYDFLRDFSNRLFAASKTLGMAKVENIRLPEALLAGGSGKGEEATIVNQAVLEAALDNVLKNRGEDANKPTLPRPVIEEKTVSDEVLKSILNAPNSQTSVKLAPQAKPVSAPEKNLSDVLAQRPPAPKVAAPPSSAPMTAQPLRQPAPGVAYSPRPSSTPPPPPTSPSPSLARRGIEGQGGGKGQVEDIRQIRQEIEKKKEEAQKQIDTKLDDLKKRQEK